MGLCLVHVTHEAVHQVGGIGTVLRGLITAEAYRKAVSRTVLIGTLFGSSDEADRALGDAGEVLYSSSQPRVGRPLADALHHIQAMYNANIVYGRRSFTADAHDSGPHADATAWAEVVLIDVRQIHAHIVNAFKARLWEQFGLDSRAHEHAWDFEEWVRLAEPAIAVMRALGYLDGPEPCVILAHEFMGVPTSLAAILHEPQRTRTIFYAHEVAPVRKIVEDHPGHDAMFYNVLSRALKRGHYVEDLFGPQDDYFKYALVKMVRHCDAIFAVGDYVREESRFMGPEFADANIELTYNGIPAPEISVERNHASKALLQDYAETLLGMRPDHVFTRVSRMSRSKGMWRDILVLDELEQRFRALGRTAVMFFLSCELPRRPNEDCWAMEREYGWPVAHREGGRDLTRGEAEFYAGVQAFNARSRNIKIVYVNQFGWSRAACGARMPEAMEFWDIRRGSDLEFGQSIYEPFGIAQIEALSFGSICVFSNVCGSAGFVRLVAGDDPVPNVIIADYTRMTNGRSDIDVLNMPADERRDIEHVVVVDVANQIVEHLPTTPEDDARLLRVGHALATQMSWDTVAREYVLPAIDRIMTHKETRISPSGPATEPATALTHA